MIEFPSLGFTWSRCTDLFMQLCIYALKYRNSFVILGRLEDPYCIFTSPPVTPCISICLLPPLPPPSPLPPYHPGHFVLHHHNLSPQHTANYHYHHHTIYHLQHPCFALSAHNLPHRRRPATSNSHGLPPRVLPLVKLHPQTPTPPFLHDSKRVPSSTAPIQKAAPPRHSHEGPLPGPLAHPRHRPRARKERVREGSEARAGGVCRVSGTS